jgi:sugar lactone lactonase YvrE
MGIPGAARLPRRTSGYVPKHVRRHRQRRVSLRALVAFLPALLAASLVGAVSNPDTAGAAGVPYSLGDVFASRGDGTIDHLSPNGTLLDTLNTGASGVVGGGMAFDPAGNLYSTGFQANAVFKFDKFGNLVGTFASGFNADPESIVRDASGNFYVGQADGTGDVVKLDPAGNVVTTFNAAPEDRGTDWVELAADHCTLFYTSEGALVKRFNVCTNTQLSDFGTSPNGGPNYALRIRPSGDVLVAATTAVYRFNAAGTVIQTYPFPSHTLFALNLDPDGNTFWTADLLTGEIFRVNIATGAVVTSFSRQGLVAGLAVFGEITVAQDTTKPTCSIARRGTTTLVTFEDNESGLQAINVLGVRNATAVVPPFTPGTNDPVTVTLNRVNTAQPGSARLRASDRGTPPNIKYCTLSGWVAT